VGAAGVAFEQANQWRVERIAQLDNQLDDYWAEAVLSAARDGHPAAYGMPRLHGARWTIIGHIETAANQTSPNSTLSTTPALEDPLRALADLDRAVIDAAAAARARSRPTLAGLPNHNRRPCASPAA